jgi:ribosomal protein S6--L-glutamate ligase
MGQKRRGTVVVVVERRYRAQAQPAGLIRALRRRGVQVRIVDADARAVRVGDDAGWLDGADLVVIRGRSTAALALATWAEVAGVPTVNSRAATEAVRNKAELAVALAYEGIPCPPTLVGSPEELAQVLEPDEYPILLKPVFGDNSEGLRLVRDRREMGRIVWPEAVALAQTFLPSDGCDLKLYGVGSTVFGVRKPSPFSPNGQVARGGGADPLPITLALRELALRCGRLFGLELFGVDCIAGSDGPVVIEVNEFPNYSGVTGVDDVLAGHVLSLAAHATLGRLAVEPVA